MKFVILGSGTGSNAEALLKAWEDGDLGRAVPVGILCDKPNARILTLGVRFGVPALHIDPGPYKSRLGDEQEQAYIDQIQAWGSDLVVLAGFMRVLKSRFLNAFEGRLINLHPSLLPSFPGLNSIRQAYEFGVKVTGCTVHHVTADLDAGPIIAQAPVMIEAGDSLEDVEAKVHAAEHKLLPAVVRQLAES